MTIRPCEPNKIPVILTEHLQKKARRVEEPLFVFPSDIAADTWSEWAVRHPEQSGVQAVALEDFTAWDKFKGAYLAGDVAEKVCIPALLRKLFVRSLIHQNLTERFITKIIPADDAETAYAFTDWLSKILPSLKLWHEKYTAFLKAEHLTAQTDPDAENQDYNALYTRYHAFLTAHHFFEPAWLEPDFIEKNKTIVLFYPELLEDFADYEDALSCADNVIAIRLPERAGANALPATQTVKPLAYKYPDARTELRRTVLHLRELHARGVRWTDMAVSVPDLETYRAYIKRECELYCVPVNIRSGEPLTKNCAGLIFSQLNDCYTSHFSYDSVRALLQNEYVPWKDDVRDVKENLIREGNRLRTICSYEDGDAHAPRRIDSWIEALSRIPTDARELAFYKEIKSEVTRICEAASFSALHTAWLVFRQKFLAGDQFTSDANNILGRCISELNDIADIEARYVNALKLTVEKPFAFFLNELNGKTYRPQETLDGVSVFPYKLSAAAHFACQFVIDASQSNLDVPYQKLGFLNTEKRKRLLGEDADEQQNASAAFVRLYAKTADDDVRFSYAEDSFAGFAIAHNALRVSETTAPCAELDAEDFFKREQNRVRDWSGRARFGSVADKTREVSVSERRTPKITESQKNAFLAWAKRTRDFEALPPYTVCDALAHTITDVTQTNRHSDTLVATQTDLARFYPCPRKWVLSSALKLREETLDTSLMQTFDMGTINHKVLELWVQARAGSYLPVTDADGVFSDEDAVRTQVADFVTSAIHDTTMDFKDSPLVLRALDAQREKIADGIMDFLHRLCTAPQKPDAPGYNTAIKGFGGYKVQGAEVALSGKTADGIALFGKIDCLLSDPESGDYVIIDYKNTAGAMPKTSALNADENGLLGDFQMPMYVRLAETPVEAAYFYAIKDDRRVCAIDECAGLSKAAEDAGVENPRQYNVFTARTVRLFEDYASDFAARVHTARFEPVIPKQKQGAFVHAEPYVVCAGCAFKGICRTTFTVGERSIASKN